MLLQGKKALITGGSSGIGLSTARLFKQNGARVAITGTDAEKLERARAELGGDTVAIRANVASLSDLTRMAEETQVALRAAFKLLFREGLTVSNALTRIEKELPQSPEILHLIQFIRSSERGIGK